MRDFKYYHKNDKKRFKFIKHDINGSPAQRLRIPNRIQDTITANYWCYLPEITDLLNEMCFDFEEVEKICCKNRKNIGKKIKSLVEEINLDNITDECNEKKLREAEEYNEIYKDFGKIIELMHIRSKWLGEKICDDDEF